MPIGPPRYCTKNQRTGKYETMTGTFKSVEAAEEWLSKWEGWWKEQGFKLVLCVKIGAKNVPVPRGTTVNPICEKKQETICD